MNRTRLTRLAPLLAGLGLGASAAAADPTAEELLNRVDDFARGDSSHARRVSPRTYSMATNTCPSWVPTS